MCGTYICGAIDSPVVPQNGDLINEGLRVSRGRFPLVQVDALYGHQLAGVEVEPHVHGAERPLSDHVTPEPPVA